VLSFPQGREREDGIAAVIAMNAPNHRNARLAGVLLGVWGGGAMIGSVIALRAVRSSDPFKLGAAAWAGQALPLWVIVMSRAPAVAVCALAASGIGNGLRVPSVTGITMRRVPQRIRAETLTASSSVVLGAGFVSLLIAGPALDAFGSAPVWTGIACLQTAAAVTFGRLARAASQHTVEGGQPAELSLGSEDPDPRVSGRP
jgi:hypothetical protein